MGATKGRSRLTEKGGMGYEFPEPSFNVERNLGPDGQADLTRACLINASKGWLSVAELIIAATESTG
jgi:hypothetical protein